MTQLRTTLFKKVAAQTIGNERLQASLKKAIHHFREGRAKAVEEMTPQAWQQLQERARDIKSALLKDLDFYLDLVARQVEANGGRVYFAKDAETACRIVAEIARSHGVKHITKTKSMVSEEIGLNHHLIEQGFDVVETDLGEYVIQLANEPPYHIIGPAMHKTRQEVAHLFGRDGDEAEALSIADLAGIARQRLREKFLNADMGISGANFVVAETGHVVLVTNEGNARYCTSLPPVHVAVTGMEKMVPSLEDLAVVLRLLTGSATGQRLSSYVTMAGGPRRSCQEDGPDEFHLVLVDNGRSRILNDLIFRDILFCMRCGSCLNHCPIFLKVGGHAYGATYPGPIGSVVTTMLEGGAKAKDMAFACTLCGICEEMCPFNLDIPSMLLELRSRINTSDDPRDRKSSAAEKGVIRAWYQMMVRKPLLTATRTLGRWFEMPLARNGRVGKVPIPILSRWTRKRDLPVFPSKTFTQIWKNRLSKDGREDQQ